MKTVFSATMLPVLTASMLALFSLNTLANEPPRSPPSFEQMDANGDQVLTKDEVQGPLLNDFDRFDTDHNGSLSEAELPAPPSH
ncbi:EF-hand domain-containing protein [Marinomonas sp. A79]|uniref:EF-hand domain-containing protein n=1 Tax=Marinomonas vulgaris TaxID=2823372 RepID=A0ABS5HBQ9_9GAMM|nr:EF-hand domain-containing protein [Marinomonas vulgaris]MBR7888862.1 EF-hand domain-containing protein [Marinomonas vulgaris]